MKPLLSSPQSSNERNAFLEDASPEIREILDWYATGRPSGNSTSKMRKFASRFLGALVEDEAVIPAVQTDPPRLLAMVLLHHRRNPQNATAWLNLGLALRRMALYRVQDSESGQIRTKVPNAKHDFLNALTVLGLKPLSSSPKDAHFVRYFGGCKNGASYLAIASSENSYFAFGTFVPI